MAESFNSSDYEQDHPTPVSKNGSRVALRIKENQLADRLASKKAVRTQAFAHGAPGTIQKMQSVENSWDAFCETVSHDVKTCPTGELVFRYIHTMARNTLPGARGKLCPSLSVIKGILSHVILLLTFRHENFRTNVWNYHHALRVQAHLTQLTTEGKLIQGLWHKKAWVGFSTILRLAECWVTNALDNGTRSWDVTLTKLLDIVLQSAMCSRVGDITRSVQYHDTESICWKDVVLTLNPLDPDTIPSVQHLRGTFCLRFTKSSKNNMYQNKTIFCDPLTDIAQSCVCPIKLILVLALRLGRVQGRDLQECLDIANSRADRTIEWLFPEAPILCAISQGTCAFLILDKPAGTQQSASALEAMAWQAGLLGRVTTQAIRRGAMRDEAYLTDPTPLGIATVSGAVTAGHSMSAFKAGVTQMYVGPLEHTTYNSRAQQSATRQDRMAPAFAGQTPPQSSSTQRMSSKEVDVFMVQRNMDVKSKNARQVAIRELNLQKKEVWRESARKAPAPFKARHVGAESAIINDVDSSSVQHVARDVPTPPVPKRRKLNSTKTNLTTQSRNLDHYFNREKDAPKSEKVHSRDRIPDTQLELSTPLTDEEFARQLQAQYDAEDGQGTEAVAVPFKATQSVPIDAVDYGLRNPLRERSVNAVNANRNEPITTSRMTATDTFGQSPVSKKSSKIIGFDKNTDELLQTDVRTLDKRQLGRLQSIENILFDNNSSEDYGTTTVKDETDEIDEIDQEMIDFQANTMIKAEPVTAIADLEAVQGVTFSQIKFLNGDQFVNFLARINIFIYKNSSWLNKDDGLQLEDLIPLGNSRDKPVLFKYYCRKGTSGCGYNTSSCLSRDQHETSCSGTVTTKVQCSRPNCEKWFKNTATLVVHVKNTHDWKPSLCPKCPESTTIFSSKVDLNNHNNAVHQAIDAISCPLVSSCGSKVTFTKKEQLRKHLFRIHRLDLEAIKEHVPDRRRGNKNGEKSRGIPRTRGGLISRRNRETISGEYLKIPEIDADDFGSSSQDEDEDE